MNVKYFFSHYEHSLRQDNDKGRLSDYVHFFKEGVNELDYDLIIIGVPESRNSYLNKGCSFAPDLVRKCFYNLYPGSWSRKVLDLGNLIIGDSVKDTYVVLESILAYFFNHHKKVIVLGGGHDLTIPLYKAHKRYGLPLNFACTDAYLDFQGVGALSQSFLSEIIADGSLLSRYILLGYQTYLCPPSQIDLLSSMDFDLVRLGRLTADINDVEPELRSIHHLSIDHCVLKLSEAPASPHGSPNGLNAAQLSALSRYAGMAHDIKSILFSELNPDLDQMEQSAKVFAQTLWYFIEGLSVYEDDRPDSELSNCQKFHVVCDHKDIVFYKNINTNRWWVQLNDKKQEILERKYEPCSIKDYNLAVKGELSDRLYKCLTY